jgi:Leucine-rich repeat (LRR) protein
MSKFEPRLNELPGIWLNKICSEFVANYDQNYLTRLDLSQNNLKSANPIIFQLANVKQIKLNGNQIETLGDIKFQSNSLEELDVSANNLNEVPASLFYLKNLKHLNVSSNQITEIPFSIWQCKSLVELNISFNALNSLPFKCKNFKLLSMPNESPTVRQQETCATIEQTINYTQKPLVKINIWNNNCEPGLKNIDDFNLNDELLSNTNVESTDNKSQYYSNIIDLNLSHNNFDDVPACLACLMPKLLKLNMSFNRIKSMGMHAFIN